MTTGGPVGTGEDYLLLEVEDLHVDLLTGVYSEETHLPQPLLISVRALLRTEPHYEPETPLAASKNYMELKRAATSALPRDRHFTLIEAIADHIIDTVFVQDDKVRHVEVKIVKLALTERQERIGITLGRWRR
jgi:dihydroneopterin aldolase